MLALVFIKNNKLINAFKSSRIIRWTSNEFAMATVV